MARQAEGPLPAEAGLHVPVDVPRRPVRLGSWLDRISLWAFLLPAVLVVLLFSLFPLVLSLYFSLTRLQFASGGFELTFVGLANYANLIVGTDRQEFLGVLAPPSAGGWAVWGAAAAGLLWWAARAVRERPVLPQAVLARGAFAVVSAAGVWLLVQTLAPQGRPGSLVVTLIYVIVGVCAQYALGLGLALLCLQRIPGRRFFRVVFLLPMMITPVGIAYLFRMLTDTGKGPFVPLWNALGLSNFSWVTVPWGARGAIMIGDVWQWTPFMFIVLLAALESQPLEPVEAAVVDGASGWQVFWQITLPGILPISSTLVLIRMIEAFKIVDLPNVLTSGGPGTATESLTLNAYVIWRALDLGGSAAIAYVLLLVVTFAAISYVHLIHRRATEAG